LAIKSRIRGGYQEVYGGRVAGTANMRLSGGSVGSVVVDRNKQYLADNYGYDPYSDTMPERRNKGPRKFRLHEED
jgi:hypothetical protein